MSGKSVTVCAIVVSYNRKKLLIECLEGLINQTKPVDAICLVDNFSTDGTPELLLKKGFIDVLPPEELDLPWEKSFKIKREGRAPIELMYIRMHRNTGSAGGFYEGLKRAYGRGYDWFWLMDDDVEPLPHALFCQLSYSGISGCIHPRKLLPGNRLFVWNYPHPVFGKAVYINNGVFGKKKFVDVKVGCFEGMLIHRDVVGEIGYPKKEFFIVGDDLYYGFLASKVTRNIYIKEICFVKKRSQSTCLADWQYYLKYRNEYVYAYRRMLRFKPLWMVSVVVKAISDVLYITVSGKKGKQRYPVVKGILLGIRDGLFEKFDNKFVEKMMDCK